LSFCTRNLRTYDILQGCLPFDWKGKSTVCLPPTQQQATHPKTQQQTDHDATTTQMLTTNRDGSNNKRQQLTVATAANTVIYSVSSR
jgi:hypothetical protein